MDDGEQEASQVQREGKADAGAVGLQAAADDAGGFVGFPEERLGARHVEAHLGFDVPGHDDVEADALGVQGVAHGFAVGFDGGFAGAVAGGFGQAAPGRQRADEGDLAVAAPAHGGQRAVHGGEYGFDVDVEQAVHVAPLFALLLRAGVDVDAGVGDDEFGHFGFAHVGQPGHERVMVAHVEFVGQDARAQRLAGGAQFLQAVGVAPLQDQGLGAGGGVFERQGAAYAAGGAGDQDAAGETGFAGFGTGVDAIHGQYR